jgi:hypothetical protein
VLYRSWAWACSRQRCGGLEPEIGPGRVGEIAQIDVDELSRPAAIGLCVTAHIRKGLVAVDRCEWACGLLDRRARTAGEGRQKQARGKRMVLKRL